MIDFIEVIKTLGVPVAILCVFMWWMYKKDQAAEKRHTKMGDRLSEIEDYQRTKLEGLSVEATQAAQSNTMVMQGLCEEFKKRPCLKDSI